MIAHIVLFEPRPGFDEASRARLVASIQSASTEIPAIRRFRVGRRVTHGLPGYEQTMTAQYGYAAVIEFEDVRGLTEYLNHPAHAAIGDYFSTGAERALAYDFELADARDLD